MGRNGISLFLILLLVLQIIRSSAQSLESEEENSGTRWAVLVAGSNGFMNYRHQADICHAYQILKKGGLKDENIIVFMYDDIANEETNPSPGKIFNRPDGEDVYAGVPKDYTGDAVNIDNLFAVILGNKKAVKGGSGKVVNSSKNDRIFIYYSDHGGYRSLGIPGDVLFAQDFVDVLKKKHKSGTYKEMVVYIEACESGSIVQDLLPENLNIYVTTASNAKESSYSTYCDYKSYPCLGDLYSIAWMEDSESNNLRKESIAQQYKKVRERTSKNHTFKNGSHVMEYGNKSIHLEKLSLYQGFNPATENSPPQNIAPPVKTGTVEQRSADLYYLWKIYKLEEKSEEKEKILKKIKSIEHQREELEGKIGFVGAFLFGPRSSLVLNGLRPALVDDWKCLKSYVKVFEKHCGPLTQYGMKYMRGFANICSAGIVQAAFEKACEVACSGNNFLPIRG